ncbi:hypothetical protein [Sorangium cellulosum]|nr:hypothetical protein [Sorangium cellulosum]
MTGLCLGIALLAALAAAAGVFFRGDGATAAAVSIRGEHYAYATTGVYRYNAERLVAEGIAAPSQKWSSPRSRSLFVMAIS